MDILLAFFAGTFLGNCIPHLVNGMSGRRFPTPFAKPPGVGYSSPLTNVLWGGGNLAVGATLAIYAAVTPAWTGNTIALFAGIMATAILLARHFGRVAAGGND